MSKEDVIKVQSKMVRVPLGLVPIVEGIIQTFRLSQKEWIKRGEIAGENKAQVQLLKRFNLDNME